MHTKLNEAFILFAATGMIFAASIYSIPAQAEPTVRIAIAGIKSQQGTLMIALHDEKSWNGKPPVAVNLAVAGDRAATLMLAPAPGAYAIKLFHDVDGNGALGKDAMGLPSEPFGFSNNAPTNFGPAEFEDAAFDVGPDGAVQTITLR